MINQREKKALYIIASGYSIDECADIMALSRSRVEQILKAAKTELRARTLANAVYKATRQGMIILCCVLTMNATECRRVARSGRREVEAVISII
jgi:DNA-binding CsgD family transcriptional regulator